MKIEETLSYDDILLLPGYSAITPGETVVSTRLVGNIQLNVPVISAAMDTVTEEKLAIALALEGGAGVIHRNLSPKDQAVQVGHVKRYLNWIIESPVTVGKDETVSYVRSLMEKFNVSGMPVLEESGKLCGIITGRDLDSAGITLCVLPTS